MSVGIEDEGARAPKPLPAEVIITHAGADFDGLASMLCARWLYPNAVPLLSGAPEPSVRHFLETCGAPLAVEQARHVERMPLTRVVVVDAQVPSRLGAFRDVVADPRVEVHVFDHHPATAEGIRGDLHCVERVGATTSLLVNRLMARSAGPPVLSALEATLYALGIYEETGNLTFPETTPHDARAVAWLLEQGASLSLVTDYTQTALRDEQHALLAEMLSRLESRTVRGMRVLVASAEADHYVGEAAVVAHRIMDLERPDALFCVTRMADRVYLVGRSRESGPDVSVVAARFGGGGHARAASASMSACPPSSPEGRPLDHIVEEVWRVVESEARPPLCARDVMSAPVQAIDVGDGITIDEARPLFTRYGHSVLPVLSRGQLQGTLTRRDVDKALQHGLGKTTVRQLVTPSVPTAPGDTAVSDLLRRMGPRASRLVVVDEAGRAIGLVTRGDILEAMRLQSHPVENEAQRLERLPRPLQGLLQRCGEVGDAAEMSVYVVGGFVRDVLLGHENLDIDVVVEGDGIRYAGLLAQALGGRVSAHHKFGTAVVTASVDGFAEKVGGEARRGEMKIDVASTRLEFYTRPAALPEVTGSTLKQDLYRRDFTMNAMAIQLNPSSYGLLVDYFGARRDLSEGVVRVLHPLSFIDDPTRIFRAIKFEQRYHFRMDPHTERLLRQAVHSKWLEALSPARVRDEFQQILSEARPVPAIRRMAELGVLRLLHPGLQLTPRVRELLDAITAVLSRYAEVVAGERVQAWIVYFRGLASGLGADDLHAVSARYVVGNEARRRLFLERDHVRHLLRRLYRRLLLPSEVYRLLSPLSLEMVLYLLARSRARSVKERIVLYLERLRTLRPIVGGADLVAWGFAPGPDIGHLLDSLRDAQLDGKIHDADEARAWLDEKDIVASWT